MTRMFIIICGLFFYAVACGQPLQDFEKEPTVKWQFKINAPIFSSPIISDGIAYFGGLDSMLYALEVLTGKEKWKIETNGEIRSTVTIVNDKLYLLGGNGIISCLDKLSGRIKWTKVVDGNALFLGERRYDFADYFHSTLTIHEGVIYFGNGNNYIRALNADNGNVLWSFKTEDIVHTKLVIYNNKVFAGSFDGYLYALDIKDGSLVWKFKSVGQQYFPKGEMQGFPVAAFGSVYIGSRDFNFYSINAETGQGNWNRKFPKGWAFAATIQDTVIFLGTAEDKLMVAMDVRNGQELWNKELNFHVFGNSAFTANLMYVPTIWGKLYALERRTGNIKWTFTTDGYKANHLKYYKSDDSYRDDIYSIFKSSLDLIKAEYSMGGIFSMPAIANDMMIITTTEGIVYGLKK